MKKNFKFSNTGNAFLLAFASYYAVNLILQALFALLLPKNIATIFSTWVMFAINAIVFVGVMYWYSRKKNVNFVSATKLNVKINKKQIGLIILLSVFSIMAFLPLSNIFLDILSRIGYKAGLSIPATDTNIWILLLSLFLLAVLPAISEEILMRGVVLNSAVQKGNYSYAIVITAGMFSLMHGNAVQTVHQFLLGMVLAYIVIVSRSLWSAIVLHFVNNFLSIVLNTPINWVLLKTGAVNLPVIVWYLMWVVSFIIGSTILFILLKKFTKVSCDKNQYGDTQIIDVYLESKAERHKNEFKKSFNQIISIFKRDGVKRAYNEINDYLLEIVPLDEPDEITREDFMPSNIKLVYTILIVIWLINFATGFAS